VERVASGLSLPVYATAAPGDSGRNYAIPTDNPFVNTTGDDEIWAWGLRNPWRNSFDRDAGDFYIADIGQDNREEINVQPAASAGGEVFLIVPEPTPGVILAVAMAGVVYHLRRRVDRL